MEDAIEILVVWNSEASEYLLLDGGGGVETAEIDEGEGFSVGGGGAEGVGRENSRGGRIDSGGQRRFRRVKGLVMHLPYAEG